MLPCIFRKKYDAAKLAADMWKEQDGHGNQLFLKQNFLSAQQILSFWSHYAANAPSDAGNATSSGTGNFRSISRGVLYRDDPNIPTEEDLLTLVAEELLEDQSQDTQEYRYLFSE